MFNKMIKLFCVLLGSLLAYLSVLILWTFAARGGSEIVLQAGPVADNPLGQLGKSFVVLLIGSSGLYLQIVILAVCIIFIAWILQDEISMAMEKLNTINITFDETEPKKYSVFCKHFTPLQDGVGYWNGRHAFCYKTGKIQPLVEGCEGCKDFITR